MTVPVDPEMKARAEGAAAQTADAICQWCNVTPGGALWDAVYEAATIATVPMLQAQREGDLARLDPEAAAGEAG